MTKKQEEDQARWEAETQVKSAFIETPKAKRLVKQTMKAIKAQNAKVKKAVKKI